MFNSLQDAAHKVREINADARPDNSQNTLRRYVHVNEFRNVSSLEHTKFPNVFLKPHTLCDVISLNV